MTCAKSLALYFILSYSDYRIALVTDPQDAQFSTWTSLVDALEEYLTPWGYAMQSTYVGLMQHRRPLAVLVRRV
jgi:hypothetical protein